MKTVLKLFTLLFFGVFTITTAQIQINLNLDPNLNPKVSEWQNQRELLLLTVTNMDENFEGLSYKIDAKLYRDDELIASTIFSRMPELKLPLGTETFYADDIIPLNSIKRSSSIERTVLKTGMLPAGNYKICVTLLNLDREQISMPIEDCRNSSITDYQLPELVYPIENMVIDENMLSATMFRWTPLVPTPKEGVKYKIAISEILKGQSPQRAFTTNTPIIEEEILQSTQFLWPIRVPAPKGEEKKYVWSVSPVNQDDEPYKKDKTKFVKIGTFSVKPKKVVNATTSTSVPDTIFAGKNHEFKIKVTQKRVKNGKLTGKGVALVDWINAELKVNFKDIVVDTDGKLTSGKITSEINNSAPKYPKDILENSLVNTWNNSLAEDVVNWVNSNASTSVKYKSLTKKTSPLNLPIKINVTTSESIALTELAFHPNKSEIALLTSLQTPASFGMNNQKVVFKASKIEVGKSAIKFSDTKLELVEDVALPNINNTIKFILKKPTTNEVGCYVVFKEQGIKNVGIDLEAEFTEEWFKPVNTSSQKTKIRLSGTGTKWKDIMLKGNFPKSKIVFMDNTVFSANEMYYDMSDLKNPAGIKFPENYKGEKGKLFRGFYAKAFEIQLPESFKVHNSGSLKISANNVIIDDLGITCKATGSNVVQYPQGNLADLAASVDEIVIDVVNNSLTKGSLKGKLALPITDPSTQANSLLDYSSVLHLAQKQADTTKVTVTISPKKGVKTDLLKGKLDINNTSTITAKVDKFSKQFDINLNGKMVWAKVNLNPIKEMTMGLKFNNVGISYDSSKRNDPLNFESGSWAFASPQKKLNGFPVTIENVKFTDKTSSGDELVRKALNLDVVFNMSKNIGGRTTLEVVGAIKKPNKFKPSYVKTSLKSINIAADLAAVKINGQLDIRDDDPVYGNGFKGTLSAEFKAAGIKANALAEFGKTKYNNSSKYRYWRVEADATFPTPGAPFIPGLAFRGFGGGAYHNMEAIFKPIENKYEFKPKKSSLGFKAKGIIATSPKEDAFNADVSLGAQFSSSQGLTQVSFGGKFFSGADLTEASRKKAMLKGNVNVNYDVPNKHFNLVTSAEFKIFPVSTNGPASLSLDVKGRTGKWYFKFGEPTNVNRVKVYGVPLYSYLMFGNDINPPSAGFTRNFINKYRRATGKNLYNPNAPSGVDQNSALGKGFAIGMGLEFKVNKNFSLFSRAGVNLGIDIGSELNLSLLEYQRMSCTNPSQKIGFNGWRAKGNMGYYLNSSVKAYYKNYRWNLARIKSDGYLVAEFPNPNFAKGQIAGKVKAGCWGQRCLIDKNFRKSFTWGSNCSGGSVDTGVNNIQQEDKAEDYQLLISSVSPARYNYQADPRLPIKVQFPMELNKPFEVTEQQSNGTFKNRKFKLEATYTLQHLDSNNQPKNVSFTTTMKANNTLAELVDSNANTVTVQEVRNTATNQFSTIGYGNMQMASVSYAGNDNNSGTYYSYGTNNSQNQSNQVESLKLKPETVYILKVKAKLKEYKNGRWSDLRTNKGKHLRQTKNILFKTKKNI